MKIKHCLIILYLLPVSILASCAITFDPVWSEANSFSELKNSETVLVGGVDWVFPSELAGKGGRGGAKNSSEESRFVEELLFVEMYLHEKFMAFDRHEKSFRKPPSILSAEKAKTFYLKIPSKPMFILKEFYLSNRKKSNLRRQAQKLIYEDSLLPFGFKIDVRKGDKAVYFGTIRLIMNEYFDVTKIELIDNFKGEEKSFRKIFGTSQRLRKRLAVPLRK